MLGVHGKYNGLVSSAFNNDSGFVASLDKVSCIFFIMDKKYIKSSLITFLEFFPKYGIQRQDMSEKTI